MVSKSQTVLWLAGEPLKDDFQLCTHRHTDGQTNKQINLIDCWTATFAVKNHELKLSKMSRTTFFGYYLKQYKA